MSIATEKSKSSYVFSLIMNKGYNNYFSVKIQRKIFSIKSKTSSELKGKASDDLSFSELSYR